MDEWYIDLKVRSLCVCKYKKIALWGRHYVVLFNSSDKKSDFFSWCPFYSRFWQRLTWQVITVSLGPCMEDISVNSPRYIHASTLLFFNLLGFYSLSWYVLNCGIWYFRNGGYEFVCLPVHKVVWSVEIQPQTIKRAVYLDVTPCNLVEHYPWFGGTYCIHLKTIKFQGEESTFIH